MDRAHRGGQINAGLVVLKESHDAVIPRPFRSRLRIDYFDARSHSARVPSLGLRQFAFRQLQALFRDLDLPGSRGDRIQSEPYVKLDLFA